MRNIRTHSDFAAFLDTMKALGIPASMNHDICKERWQKIISEGGYNITSLACVGVVIGSVTFLFSHGRPDWRDETGNGEGEPGAFLMAYDEAQKKIVHRRHINENGEVLGDAFGVVAMMTPPPKDEPKHHYIRITSYDRDHYSP